MFSGCRFMMRLKSVGRPFRVVLLLYLLLASGGAQDSGLMSVNAQVPDIGEQFLTQKETDVMAIARSASGSNANCGTLNNCTGPACSRAICKPVKGWLNTLTCTLVDNNVNFDVCDGEGCVDKMLLDYTQSFVTLPAPAYLNVQTEVARDICLQRTLDSTVFKNVSTQANYSHVYLGSASGAFRAFPGREQNTTRCTTFDPRRRPWYISGTTVQKDVKILVDTSFSMGLPVPAQYQPSGQTTYLNVTQNITRGLLQTFAPLDYVEVIAFDSHGGASLRAPQLMSASFDYKTADRPELQALIGGVNALVASGGVGKSNLTDAVVKAVNSGMGPNFLKVIIVLTDGNFAPLDAGFPTQALVSSQTKVMIFKLPPPSLENDPYLLATSLRTTLCAVKGSFELLDPQSTTNPRYAMRSYFTFLAQTQLVAAASKPTWSNTYTSVSQDVHAITVTYPAFDLNDGKLIGVAGIDVIVDSLSPALKSTVLSDFKNHRQGILSVPPTIPMSCNYQNSTVGGVCPSAPTPDSTAICQDLDNVTLKNSTCCGDCGSPTGGGGGGGGGGGDGLKPGAIAGIAVAAAVAATVVAVALYFFCRPSEEGPPENEIFGGSRREPIIPGGQDQRANAHVNGHNRDEELVVPVVPVVRE